jgi:hypothetical protein
MAEADRTAARERGHDIFDPLAQAFLRRDDVDIGRMFASEGLRIRGKIFAFLGFDGELILKVPADRIEILIAEGDVARMVMRGRPLREWVTVAPSRADRWGDLIEEAYAFVDRITPGGTG